jgi:hypothetical protein
MTYRHFLWTNVDMGDILVLKDRVVAIWRGTQIERRLVSDIKFL